MPKLLAGPVLGVFSMFVVIINTVICAVLLYLTAVGKLVLPEGRWNLLCARLSDAVARTWVGVNSLGLDLTKDIRWDIQGMDGLKRDRWYLLVANHQSMVDITVLQKIFHRRAPLLKFFLKKELFWVPVLGIAWWALDFPFMKRTSSARKDLETTRKACEKFRLMPVTVMNFLEGTRFSPEKREEQNSPYTNLLKPKAGGIAVVLGTMGEQIHSILDVTIVYPAGVPGMWQFLCARSLDIKVRVKQIPVTAEFRGDYFSDREFRRGFNNWLNSLWDDKDRLIESLLTPPVHGTVSAGKTASVT